VTHRSEAIDSATVHQVPGSREDTAATAMQAAEQPGTFYASWAALKAGLVDADPEPGGRPWAVSPLCDGGLKSKPPSGTQVKMF
jgi:hypothetical protein